MPDEQQPTPESSDSERIDGPPTETPPDSILEAELSELEGLETGDSEPETPQSEIEKEDSNELESLVTDEIVEAVLEEVAEDMGADVTSQENQTSIAVPPIPVPPTSTAQSQTLQTLQSFWQTTQPKLKAGTIKLLKTTIQLLEGAVAQLEGVPEGEATTDQPFPTQPSSRPARSTDWGNDLVSTVQRGWQRFWVWWNDVLPKIRGILPASINEALSDRALTGAIAGILVLVLWTGSSIFSSHPPKQVAVVPPTKTTPAKPTSIQEKKAPKPKNLPEVKVIPPPKPSPQPAPAQPAAESPKLSPSPTAQSSPAPSPTPLPSPTPKPSPQLKLTPEQTLIARIQDQVAEVSDRYVNGLIQSVQANFRSSRLNVKVGDGWYSLLPPQQDNLANDVLQRAQQLNFIKLEIADEKGTLLARSPVVGSEMIVLKRSLASL